MPPASFHPHIRIVQSRQNSRVKELRAGFARGNSARTRAVGESISIEGFHLLEEALSAGLRVGTIFVRTGSEDFLDKLAAIVDADLSAVEILQIPAEVFSSAAETESPQGIAALVEPPIFSLDDVFAGPSASDAESSTTPLVVVAASLQDPGNLGTLIRSAEAFGGTGLIALPGTVSQWNPKALRASSGSAFRLPAVAASEADALSRLRSSGLKILAATVDGGASAASLDLTVPMAILIGNEGAGLSASLIEAADQRITIPCPGPVESLNAAVAASILLYEAARQRGDRIEHRRKPA
ncbi:MAG TPA: RNA methyltransferase [Acidisarcina sp.]